MMLLYFLPTKGESFPPTEYASSDLPTKFIGDPVAVFLRSYETPAGCPGFMLYQKDDSHVVKKYSKTGHWLKQPGQSYYVGIEPGVACNPEQLERTEMLGGIPWNLGDGQQWIVPVVRIWLEGRSMDKFPKYMKLGEDGRWTQGEVLDKYVYLSNITRSYWEKAYEAINEAIENGKDSYDVGIDDPIGLAVTVLQANYRIGPAEASLLRLFTSDNNALAIVNVSVGVYFYISYVTSKKKLTEESASGEAA